MKKAVLVRRIAARPAIVFNALVTAEGMGSWWGPDDQPVLSTAADTRVGGDFRIRFRTSDGLEHECIGQFLEIEEPHRIAMSYQWASGGVSEEGNEQVSRLEFHLRPIDTGTELTLVHSALRNEASARSHERGWGRALEKLMRVLANKSQGGVAS